MCKYNGIEIKEQRKASGETIYCLRDVVHACGYRDHNATLKIVRHLRKITPGSVFLTEHRMCSSDYYCTLDSLKIAAYRATQGPVWNSKAPNWSNIISLLEKRGDTSSITTSNHTEQATNENALFSKIDGLIEEYTSFKEQYQLEHAELLALREQVKRYREVQAAALRTLGTASGF